VRCKLAGVLLQQHDYEACRRQLVAAEALLPTASACEQQQLAGVRQQLRVAWPLL
jgi:hypothetical protein